MMMDDDMRYYVMILCSLKFIQRDFIYTIVPLLLPF